MVKIFVDGKEMDVDGRETIFQAARKAGIELPHLCYDERLEPHSICKLCIVQADGDLTTSCNLKPQDGMRVQTLNKDVAETRRMALEHILSDHYGDCIGPCRDKCPSHSDVETYIALTKAGRYHEAVKVMKERYILPAVLGRVCPAFCEENCRRNLVEGALSIRMIKRFAADQDLKDPWMPDVPNSKGRKIAIVGGGPAGLSCAYYLRTKGYGVTIFEAMGKLGGMTRYGIPEYRLSRDVLDRDIATVTDTGIEVKTNRALGSDITLDECQRDYNATFLGIGAWKSIGMRVEGENLKGVMHGIEFLRRRNKGEKVELGKKVIVVGGGNTAIDVARTALRLGSDVTLAYRRSRKEMPANEEEVDEAEEEGVKINLLVNPVKFHGDNKLEKVELIKMELGEPDESGRRRPVPIEGSNFFWEADNVILAIGQRCDEEPLKKFNVGVERGKTIVDDVTLETSIPGVFAGGDCVLGPSTVIESIASGRRAAIMIDLYLKGKLELAKNVLLEPSKHVDDVLNDEDLYDVLFDLEPYTHWRKVTEEDYKDRERIPRVEKKLRNVEERIGDFDEVEISLAQEEVEKEADRCMSCGCMKLYECKLREYSTIYDARQIFEGERVKYPEIDHPFFTLDENKCISCGLCVDVCNEIQQCEVLNFVQKGYKTITSTPVDEPFEETDCVFCGNCLSVCPVGALSEKERIGKGREWEFEKTVTTCPYCGVGCELHLEIKDGKVVRVTSPQDAPANNGWLCIKGRYGLEFVNSPDRLTTPLIKENGEFKEISWNEALDIVASRLNKIKEEHGPDAIAGLSSAKCTNEENYLFQKFMRAVVGTNNVDHCARLCHASTVAGLARAFGSGAMTNSMEELSRADCILITGSNTSEAHPVIALQIKKAVKNGAKLIVADPRKIELVDYAELWLRQDPGTDVALFNGMMWIILNKGLEDVKFIDKRTEGFGSLKEALKDYPPEKVEKITGVPAEQIEKAAELYAKANRSSIVYAMGITQHTTGTDNVLSLANLAMITGNVGRESTGVNPLRGQNNVQGACDLGALPNVFPGYQNVEDAKLREKFENAWGVSLPGKKGLTVVEMMHGIEDGKIKGMYIMGENSVLTDPDSTRTKKALEQLDFLVVQDIFLSETAKLADLVLPATCFAEKDGAFTNTERRVQRVRKALNPPGEARADWEIICDVATRMRYPMKYRHPSEIMDEIAALSPIYGGIIYPRLEGKGLQWPCPDKNHPGTKYLHKDRFTRGKGKFHPTPYRPPVELPDEEYPFILSTGRVLYHFHTGTMTHRVRGIERIYPEGLVEVNSEDASSLGLSDGDMAKVRSRRGEVTAKVRITDRSPRGVVFMTFHFKDAAANILTIDALDPIAKIPEFKVCAVSVEPVTS